MKQYSMLAVLPILGLVALATACVDGDPLHSVAPAQKMWNLDAALAAVNGSNDNVTLAVSFRDSILPADSSLLLNLGGGVDYRFYTLPVLTTKLPEVAAEHLSLHPRVEHVSIGRRGRLPAIREAVSWGFGAHETAHAHSLGYTGQGIVIAILDTGVKCSLADFQCVPGTSFVSGKAATDDDHGHGTAVASEAAARSSAEFSVV